MRVRSLHDRGWTLGKVHNRISVTSTRVRCSFGQLHVEPPVQIALHRDRNVKWSRCRIEIRVQSRPFLILKPATSFVMRQYFIFLIMAPRMMRVMFGGHVVVWFYGLVCVYIWSVRRRLGWCIYSPDILRMRIVKGRRKRR